MSFPSESAQGRSVNFIGRILKGNNNDVLNEIFQGHSWHPEEESIWAPMGFLTASPQDRCYIVNPSGKVANLSEWRVFIPSGAVEASCIPVPT